MNFTPEREITIEESIDAYLDHMYEYGQLSNSSVDNRRIELKRFLKFCNNIKISKPHKLHKNHFKEYIKRLNVSNGTKNTLINIYRSYFDYLVEEAIILDNIASTVKRPKINKAMPDYLTLDELEKLYQLEAQKASPKVVDRNLLILSIFVELGLRVSELVNIKMTDVDLESRQSWVTRKGGRTKKVPFPESIKEQIETWLDVRPTFKNSETEEWLFLSTTGRQLNRKQVYEIISNAVNRAGLVKRKKGPHLLRHTGATLRSMRGDDSEAVRNWLDHKTDVMSRIYNHAGKVLQQKAIENELLKDKGRYRGKKK